jgi:hypothetical protein
MLGDATQKKAIKYAFVIDGEVAFVLPIQNGIEMIHAVMQSDPKVCQIPDELQMDVQEGWIFDGVSYSPPSEG